MGYKDSEQGYSQIKCVDNESETVLATDMFIRLFEFVRTKGKMRQGQF